MRQWHNAVFLKLELRSSSETTGCIKAQMNLKHLLYFSCYDFSSSQSFHLHVFYRMKASAGAPFTIGIYLPTSCLVESFILISPLASQEDEKQEEKKGERVADFLLSLLCSTLPSATLKVTPWSRSRDEQLLYKDGLLKRIAALCRCTRTRT